MEVRLYRNESHYIILPPTVHGLCFLNEIDNSILCDVIKPIQTIISVPSKKVHIIDNSKKFQSAMDKKANQLSESDYKEIEKKEQSLIFKNRRLEEEYNRFHVLNDSLRRRNQSLSDANLTLANKYREQIELNKTISADNEVLLVRKKELEANEKKKTKIFDIKGPMAYFKYAKQKLLMEKIEPLVIENYPQEYVNRLHYVYVSGVRFERSLEPDINERLSSVTEVRSESNERSSLTSSRKTADQSLSHPTESCEMPSIERSDGSEEQENDGSSVCVVTTTTAPATDGRSVRPKSIIGAHNKRNKNKKNVSFDLKSDKTSVKERFKKFEDYIIGLCAPITSSTSVVDKQPSYTTPKTKIKTNQQINSETLNSSEYLDNFNKCLSTQCRENDNLNTVREQSLTTSTLNVNPNYNERSSEEAVILSAQRKEETIPKRLNWDSDLSEYTDDSCITIDKVDCERNGNNRLLEEFDPSYFLSSSEEELQLQLALENSLKISDEDLELQNALHNSLIDSHSVNTQTGITFSNKKKSTPSRYDKIKCAINRGKLIIKEREPLTCSHEEFISLSEKPGPSMEQLPPLRSKFQSSRNTYDNDRTKQQIEVLSLQRKPLTDVSSVYCESNGENNTHSLPKQTVGVISKKAQQKVSRNIAIRSLSESPKNVDNTISADLSCIHKRQHKENITKTLKNTTVKKALTSGYFEDDSNKENIIEYVEIKNKLSNIKDKVNVIIKNKSKTSLVHRSEILVSHLVRLDVLHRLRANSNHHKCIKRTNVVTTLLPSKYVRFMVIGNESDRLEVLDLIRRFAKRAQYSNVLEIDKSAMMGLVYTCDRCYNLSERKQPYDTWHFPEDCRNCYFCFGNHLMYSCPETSEFRYDPYKPPPPTTKRKTPEMVARQLEHYQSLGISTESYWHFRHFEATNMIPTLNTKDGRGNMRYVFSADVEAAEGLDGNYATQVILHTMPADGGANYYYYTTINNVENLVTDGSCWADVSLIQIERGRSPEAMIADVKRILENKLLVLHDARQDLKYLGLADHQEREKYNIEYVDLALIFQDLRRQQPDYSDLVSLKDLTLYLKGRAIHEEINDNYPRQQIKKGKRKFVNWSVHNIELDSRCTLKNFYQLDKMQRKQGRLMYKLTLTHLRAWCEMERCERNNTGFKPIFEKKRTGFYPFNDKKTDVETKKMVHKLHCLPPTSEAEIERYARMTRFAHLPNVRKLREHIALREREEDYDIEI